jgi:hypothetical protein
MDAFPHEGIEVSDFNQIVLGKIKNLRHIHKTKKANSSVSPPLTETEPGFAPK